MAFMDHNRKLYIETVGCQMNMLDSELVVAALRRHGYELTPNVHEADTVLFNTCSVREHAEHKIYSQLGRLKYSKRHRPLQVIGVLGCMAQKGYMLVTADKTPISQEQFAKLDAEQRSGAIPLPRQ